MYTTNTMFLQAPRRAQQAPKKYTPLRLSRAWWLKQEHLWYTITAQKPSSIGTAPARQHQRTQSDLGMTYRSRKVWAKVLASKLISSPRKWRRKNSTPRKPSSNGLRKAHHHYTATHQVHFGGVVTPYTFGSRQNYSSACVDIARVKPLQRLDGQFFHDATMKAKEARIVHPRLLFREYGPAPLCKQNRSLLPASRSSPSCFSRRPYPSLSPERPATTTTTPQIDSKFNETSHEKRYVASDLSASLYDIDGSEADETRPHTPRLSIDAATALSRSVTSENQDAERVPCIGNREPIHSSQQNLRSGTIQDWLLCRDESKSEGADSGSRGSAEADTDAVTGTSLRDSDQEPDSTSDPFDFTLSLIASTSSRISSALASVVHDSEDSCSCILSTSVDSLETHQAGICASDRLCAEFCAPYISPTELILEAYLEQEL